MTRKKEQTSKWRGRVFRYAPFLLCVLVILFLSTGEGSMVRTSLFVRPFLEFLFPGASEETLVIYHGYVRKLAHLTEYAALAFTAARAFRTSSKRFLNTRWGYTAVISVLAVAVVDETYQSFNPARTGSIFDVMIDLTGGFIGLLTFVFITRFFFRSQQNQ